MQNSGLTDLSRLKRRLTAVFLAVAAVLIAGGVLYHRHYQAVLRANAERLLLSIEEIKLGQLKNWREDRQNDTLSLLDSPILSVYLRRLAADPGDKEALNLLDKRLQAYLKHNPYSFAAIADAGGKVLISAGKDREASCPEIRGLISRAAASGRPELGEFYLQPGETSPHLDLAALAAKKPGGRAVFLLLRIDPAEFLYPLLQSWSAKGDTGEVLLVGRDGDEVLFLNDLRHVKGAALKLRFPITKEGLPAALALKGHRGIVKGRDYRGVEVLAAVSPVDGTEWAMVTKLDWDEVMRGTGTIAVMLVLCIMSLLAAAGTGAFLLFRLQVKGFDLAYQEAAGGKKLAEAELRRTETIFTQFMEHSPIYVFFKDEKIRPVLLSRNFEKMLGRPLKELIGRSMDELFPSDLAKKMVTDDLRLLKDGKEVVLEEELNGRSYITTKFPISVEGGPRYLAGFTMDITEQKQAMLSLARSRSLLAETERIGRVGGWEFNIDTMRQTWTDEVYRIHELEITPDPTVEAGINYYAPESRPLIERAVQGAIEKGEGFDLDLEIITAKGNRRAVHTVGMADLAERRVYGFFQDITERVTAQKELEREMKKAAAYLEMAGVMFVAIDADQRVSLINGKGCALLGRKKEDIIGKNWFNLVVPPAQRAAVKNVFAAMMSGKSELPEYYENEVLAADGAARLISWHNTVLMDAAGNITGTLSSGEDITDRRRAEAALNESERRFRQLFECMVEGFALHEIICDAEGRPVDYRFLDLNPAFERLTGWKKADIIGRTCMEVMPSVEKLWIENYGRVALGGEPMHFESASAVLDKVYEVTAFCPRKGQFAVSFFDVTERRRTEREIETLNHALQEKNREMESFLYITTHDLRSPLVNIQGFSQNLQRYLGEIRELLGKTGVSEGDRQRADQLAGEKIPEALSFILDSSGKMDLLLTALLKVSRMGRQELKPERLDMDLLLRKITDTMRFQLDEAGAQVTAGPLPACRGDALSVNQLFSNLLDNAVKYRDPQRRLAVSVTAETGQGKVFYKVSDNGPGIPAEDLPKIWDVFYKPGLPGLKKGEGIGLPMVKRITERNGGTIKVESKPGEGTVFTVELPAVQGEL